MQYLKLSFLLLTFLGALNLSAQDSKALLGEWETKDSDGHGKYSIFEHNGKLYAYMYYWKDDKEEFSLEKEIEKELGKYSNQDLQGIDGFSEEEIFEHAKELIVLQDFVPKGKAWKGKIAYDDEGNTVDGSLKILNQDEIEVAYSYWGMSDKSVWKRIR